VLINGKSVMFKSVVAWLLAMVLATPVAAISIGDLENEIQKSARSEIVATYISGVAMGYMFSNMALEAEGNAMMFCMPREKRPTPQYFLNLIFDAEHKGFVDASAQAEITLLARLKAKYPCK